MSHGTPPDGFEYVNDPRPSRAPWLRCLACGDVIQGSGLGIGAHRRSRRHEMETMLRWLAGRIYERHYPGQSQSAEHAVHCRATTAEIIDWLRGLPDAQREWPLRRLACKWLAWHQAEPRREARLRKIAERIYARRYPKDYGAANPEHCGTVINQIVYWLRGLPDEQRKLPASKLAQMYG